MSTAAGFVKFMGKNGVLYGKTYFDIHFEKNGLVFPVSQCDSKNIDGKDEFGYPILNDCSCNNCEDSCTNNFEFPSIFFK